MTFNLFATRASANYQVVDDGNALLAAMERAIAERQQALDALGESHWQIDMDLVKRIHAVLDPRLGPESTDGSGWFHSMDWHGDGVRHLEFQPDRLPVDLIPELQHLLHGDATPFSILCWAPLAGVQYGDDSDGCVIFNDRVYITRGLATMLARP